MGRKSTPNIPRVVMISFWRNDMNNRIEERTQHLLAKSYPNIRYVWAVGDSTDETEEYLWSLAENDKRITVIRHDTNIEGDTPDIRLQRLSLTANAGLMEVRKTDKWVCIHESDLVTPVDVIEQFIATGKDVVAGWVTLGEIFYDTYAYRKDGVKFTNHAPYNPVYRPDEPFELDSVGSCWIFPAKAGIYCTIGGCVEMCDNLKKQGYAIWCEPRIRVVQPIDLWTSRNHASY